MAKILLVDDDPAIILLLSDTLEDAGFTVDTVDSGEKVLELLENNTYDLIILDVMLGGISGFQVCKKIRGTNHCPILMLSAKNTTGNIIDGLSYGADDYLVKPFIPNELLARVNAHLRRENRHHGILTEDNGTQIQIGDILINQKTLTVHKKSEPVALSTREFELLFYLMQHQGETLSKEKIYRDVWITEFGDIGAVAINIKNIRNKIDTTWDYIKTVWGSGYRFISPIEENETKLQVEAT